ncbi:MAG TPA: transcription termination/antitermination protein NusG [Pirellulaceae bacterium]|nr:transcription termination/antitermination protein NusG [Pirellulaceae bacterium]
MSTDGNLAETGTDEQPPAIAPAETNVPAEDAPVVDLSFSPEELANDIEEEWGDENASPIEELVEAPVEETDDIEMQWYILKVQVNRENKICDALKKNIVRAGLEKYFDQVLVPTEDVREFTKSGKQRVVKRKLYPGYIVVRMSVNDATWFLVRDTMGIGDFTGAAGKPVPLSAQEIERILASSLPPADDETSEERIKTAIRFKVGDRVRVKEGYFQNYEGELSNIDERNGRITVMINIFGRANPVQLDHWQVEGV